MKRPVENSASHSKAIQRLNGNVEEDAIRRGRKREESLVIWVTCSVNGDFLKIAATYTFSVPSTSGRAKGKNMKPVNSNFNIASNSSMSKMAHVKTHTVFLAKSLSLS